MVGLPFANKFSPELEEKLRFIERRKDTAASQVRIPSIWVYFFSVVSIESKG
jgi:Rad3-related DNA helicase